MMLGNQMTTKWEKKKSLEPCLMRTTSYLMLYRAINDYYNNINVGVQFYHWFKFSFLLFLGIVTYDNEFETKENKI